MRKAVPECGYTESLFLSWRRETNEKSRQIWRREKLMVEVLLKICLVWEVDGSKLDWTLAENIMVECYEVRC